jgi:hypothetical protein
MLVALSSIVSAEGTKAIATAVTQNPMLSRRILVSK